MDRRTLLQTLLARPSVMPARDPTTLNTSFAPYNGEWTFQQAAHLLRRAMFGPTYAQIQWAAEQGMEAVIDQLFADQPMPDPPVNTRYENDPAVPVGATWVNAPYTNVSNEQGYRDRSLYSWTIGLLLSEGISAREKLTLFWHNHFPVNQVLDPKYLYRYITLLRTYAWGNFRELTRAITIDPAMLVYLNGNSNTNAAPNENYARELLELFTIGKGPAAGPGDYTYFTEQDVGEIARVLSGWNDYGFLGNSAPDGAFGAEFLDYRHDTGLKTLSERFDNVEIPDLGDQEYAFLIDIIFQKTEVARFICRKLYQWFVYYLIDEDIEANIIEPMAQVLLDHDFEIRPAVQALLSSEHFFDPQHYGVMIKNPLDFLLSIVKSLEVPVSPATDQLYDSWYALYGQARSMQLQFYRIPEVAGWKAYYLAPLFYRHWITSSTLPVRMEASDKLATSGIYPFQGNGIRLKVDVLNLVNGLNNPTDPNALIEELGLILFPRPLSAGQRDALKAILLPGLPDFEWTVEYGTYLADPGNTELAGAIEDKLRGLLRAMFTMPEFYLS